ncbi:MAG: P-loop NTPase [Clostridia bacterium]|nr:P-loop NTPase [Clostridia bacterium]
MAKKIVIASGKGGVGKSSLTVGLCRALHARGRRVLAVDCDLGLRSLDLLFSAGGALVYDWGDVLRGACAPESACIDAGGVSLLAAPLRESAEFTAPRMREMIAEYDAAYDYILIDAPAGVVGEFSLAAAAADSALIVATADGVCLRSAGRAAGTLRELGVSDRRLVLNRFHRAAAENSFLVNIDESIDRVGVQLIGVVPEDPEVTFRLPKGDPLPKKSPAQAAWRRIAGRIEGENIPLSFKKL